MADFTFRVVKLSVSFPGGEKPVRSISFEVKPGELLAIVGESGSGKSLSMQAIAGLLSPDAKVEGEAFLEENALFEMSTSQWQKIRGSRIAMIWQDPQASLNPTMTVGDQIAEVLVVHEKLRWNKARKEAATLLERTGVPDAQRRSKAYPFQFSGGMLQRVMIAMALAGKPSLLIADEPTTALDVTTQQQIMMLLRDLQKETGMAVILVTHDLGLVAGFADRVGVMYAGELVEMQPTNELMAYPRHPYTQALLASLPSLFVERERKDDGRSGVRLPTLQGQPPHPSIKHQGCSFFNRCAQRMNVCRVQCPPAVASDPDNLAEFVCCWHYRESDNL